jgi:hypothetical protein
VKRSYSHHANAYVVKPADFDAFADVVREIDRFYTQIVSQPGPSPSRAGAAGVG